MSDEIEEVTAIYQLIAEFVINYSFQILGAIIIVAAGAWVAGKVGKFVEGLMTQRNIDVTLSRFTGGSAKATLLVMVAIIALGNLGISVTPFIAAVGALGLGAGLAIQGMLANYAAGFTIIVTRPFVVGDTIQIQGVAGVVSEVQLGYTLLVDEDDVRIQIPNRHIVGEILHNSAQQMLIELQIGVAYGSDIELTKQVIQTALASVEGTSAVRQPIVGIDQFGESSIDFGVRIWSPATEHFQIRYQANEAIYLAIENAGIEIPYPRRDLHIVGSSDSLGG